MTSPSREIYTVYYDAKNLPVDNLDVAYATIKNWDCQEPVRLLLSVYDFNFQIIIYINKIFLCFEIPRGLIDICKHQNCKFPIIYWWSKHVFLTYELLLVIITPPFKS